MALGKNKILWGLLGLIVISVISTGFYINDFTKTNIRESLIDEKTEIQNDYDQKSCSKMSIQSFNRLLIDMKTISESTQVQQSLTNNQTQEYLS